MNRHLDRTYLEKDRPVKQGALVIDFGVFFLEAIILFVAGSALRVDLVTFYLLGIVLLIDMMWASLLIRSILPERNHMFGSGRPLIHAGAAAFFVVLYQFDHKPLHNGRCGATFRCGLLLCWDSIFRALSNAWARASCG